MDAFMKDVLNVKPVLLKQNAPKWMPFVAAVLNAKLFLVSHDAPHMDAFSVEDIVNTEPFLFDILPLK